MIKESTIEANGITFACLESGSGPLVLLLHGFPDIAWTWEHQLRALAEAGFRAVAPYLRGFAPTKEHPGPGQYRGVAKAMDAIVHSALPIQTADRLVS